MDKNTVRHKRNKMVIQYLWAINILDYFFYILNEQDYKIIWPPVGLIICLCVTFLFLKNINSKLMMYLLVTSIFGYILYINIVFPDLVNYLFLYSGVIVSAFYLSIQLLLLSSTVSILLLTFIYILNGSYIFDYKGYEDFPYFILFGIFISTLLFILLRFTNELWNKAVENEQRVKKDLQSTKSYFESLFTYSKDAICIMDKQGNILEVNDAFEQLFSYSQKVIYQKPFIDLFITENDVLCAALEKVKSGAGFGDLELIHKSLSTESEVIAEATISPIYGSNNKLIAISAIIRDVTDKKLIEEYMRNSEKLKVTGEIAAGVAHEIRNPLTVIAGFIQMLQEENNPQSQYYSIINSEISRMNAIISEFLILSKPHATNLKIHDIKELADEVVLLFQSESHFKNVQIHLAYEEEYYPVLCEGNQLKQVFINLIKNSFEAMPKGGTIHINICVHERNSILLLIEDTGTGIPEHHLPNVGKPFFTTKEDGTGLGFMITERIIEQHKGSVKINSRVNEGTKVEVILPITRNMHQLVK